MSTIEEENSSMLSMENSLIESGAKIASTPRDTKYRHPTERFKDWFFGGPEISVSPASASYNERDTVTTPPKDMDICNLSPSEINLIQSRVFSDLRVIFNRRIQSFFENEFDDKLEGLVEYKLNDILQSRSINHTSLLENSQQKIMGSMHYLVCLKY